MILTKDPRSGRYVADIRNAAGKRIRLSTKATTKEEAQKTAKLSGIAELEAAARSGNLSQRSIAYLTAGKNVTMNSALSDWLEHMKVVGKSESTQANGLIHVRCLIDAEDIGKLSPASVTEAHIAAVVNSPTKTTKLSTRRNFLSRLTVFFDFCSAKGWCFGNPARLVPVNHDILSHEQKESSPHAELRSEEIDRILEVAQSRQDAFWVAAIQIGRWTGLRISDISQLQWASLSKPGFIAVWTGKTNRRVELPLEPSALQDAIRRIPQEHTKFCFPTQAAISMDIGRKSLMSKQFERLCLKAGVKGKSFHGLRCYYISEARRNGRTLEHIASAVGHSHTSTTQGYVRE